MDFAAAAFDDMALLAGFDDAKAFYEQAAEDSRADLAMRADIRSANIQVNEADSWSADVEFADIEHLLGRASGGGLVELGTYQGENVLQMRFNRANAGVAETLIPVLKDPAFSLFNPVSTEGIGEESYIRDILGFTFGEENIPGIRLSEMTMTIEVPGRITRVHGGFKESENTAVFQMPLSRFLVPDEEILWAVSWTDQ